MIGAPGFPANVPAASSVSGFSPTGATSSVVEFTLACIVTIGSAAPATNPTVQFSYSLDGSSYFLDGGPFIVPITVVSTSYTYTYTPPIGAQNVQLTVTNGTTNPVGVIAQLSSLLVTS